MNNFDIDHFVKAVKKLRAAQKEYYSYKGQVHKRDLLIRAKQHEKHVDGLVDAFYDVQQKLDL